VGDVDLLPEAELMSRAAGKAPGDLRSDRRKLDVARLFDAAETSAAYDESDVPRLRRLAGDRDSGVRYWAAMGFLIRGQQAVSAGAGDLRKLLTDESPSVRVAAAEALATWGETADVRLGVEALLQLADARRSGYLVAVAAMNALDHLPEQSRPPRSVLLELPTTATGVNARMNDYLIRLKKHLTRL
jgi:uncharacterized sulfatase